MIVVLTGAPGAGKGTQAEFLAQRNGYRKLSTGDALRKHVKLGTAIGKVAGAIMERGELVSDDVLFGILKEELSHDAKPGDVILLDGYPRNIAQAECLDSLKASQPVKAVIQLEVPRDVLVSRLSGRRVCASCGATYHVHDNPPRVDAICDKCGGKVAQRTDDNASSVSHRLDVYETSTRPIVEYYRQRGLYQEVLGTGSVEGIYQELKRRIAGL